MNHPENRSKERGRENTQHGGYPNQHIPALIERDGDLCAWCGRKPESPPHKWPSRNARRRYRDIRPTRDHVIPRSEGGADTVENMLLACHRCNVTRGGMPAAEFLEVAPAPLTALVLRAIERAGGGGGG